VEQSVVRGLDYYTDTVFEVVSADLGDDLSLCGGGRYDNLIQQLGGPPTPSVGVGIGIERLLTTLMMRGFEPEANRPDAFIIAGTKAEVKSARQLANELRTQGFAVLADIDDKPVKGQFKQADRSGARYAVILGAEGQAPGSITLKDLASGENQPMQREALANRLREK
ncbi:MAG: His/Gly/Thr/Pro-type tRNA ligase C-terminal domain-containing protein, partial [Armatimonadota bacterium]